MNCAVAITSFADPECQTKSTTQETSLPLELIVGIVLGVLLIVVLSSATVVVIIVVVLLRRSKKAKNGQSPTHLFLFSKLPALHISAIQTWQAYR